MKPGPRTPPARAAPRACGLLVACISLENTVSTDASWSGINRARAGGDVEGQGMAVAVYSATEIKGLLGAVAKRDAAAFDKLYQGTCAKLYGVVLRILRRHDLAG